MATASCHQSSLRFVGARVTAGAIQLQGFLQGHHLVLNLGVALLAFDIVLGDVDFVEKGRVVESVHTLRQVVTGPTSLLLGHPVADGHIRVAF